VIALASGAFIGAILFFRTWWLTGNPAYPYGWGGTGWDSVYGKFIFDRLWLGPDRPRTVAGLAAMVASHIATDYPLVLLGLPLALFCGRSRRDDLFKAGGVALIGGAVWAIGWPVPRYLLPQLLCLTGVAAEGLARWIEDARTWRWTRLGAVWTVAVLGLMPTLSTVQHTGGGGVRPILPVALGLEQAESFHARTLGSYWRARAFLANAAHSGDRVIIVGDVRSGLFPRWLRPYSQDATDRDTLASIVLQSRTSDRIGVGIRQTGAAYVAVSRDAAMRNATYRRLTGRGFTLDRIRLWAGWWTAHATQVYGDAVPDRQNGSWAIYRIARAAGASPALTWDLPGTEEFVESRMEAPIAFQISLLEGAERAAPSVLMFKARLGELLAARGEWRKARPELAAAVDNPCAEDHHLLNLGVVLHQLGRDPEAVSVYRAGAMRFPDDDRFRQVVAGSR